MTGHFSSIKIAVVGDVHDLWEEEDDIALKHLGVNLVLLVGDFGNEAVEVVHKVAAIDLPKAVILGNHDAWYSASDWGIKQCPYDRQKEDRVQQQLDLLGETHVGYGKLDFPELNLTVVGSRPFSWGGSTWRSTGFYQRLYGVSNYEESVERIVSAAASAACETVIFLGHCGPMGLGDRAEDPCGRDWKPTGGDFGDPDFAQAIARTQDLGKSVPLVAFGHMHHNLHHSTDLRIPLKIQQGTVYLNAARVPRIVRTETECLRNFSLVTLEAGTVTDVSLVWVDQDLAIASNQILYHPTSPLDEVPPIPVHR